MPWMHWHNDFSVGVAAIDAQHQTWFGILNRLHDAMLTGKGKDVQQAILTEMVAYTRNHFQREEALLERKAYPQLSQHKEKHTAFTRQMENFELRIRAGTPVLTMDLIDHLKDWLNRHILDVDRGYAEWVRTH